ncbi:MAG: HAMP domain-containing protein [Candidatus Aminicenantes bacterium]|nr:MAG: HAMP domain-containing protein [Candidatus Aminicenantes bacterium]
MTPGGKYKGKAGILPENNYSFGISRKIWLSLSIMIIGYLVWMIFGFFRDQRTLSRLHIVQENVFPAAMQSKAALTKFNDQVKLYKDAVVFGNEELLEDAQASADEAQQSLDLLLHLTRHVQRKRTEVRELLKDLKNFSTEANSLYAKLASGLEDDSFRREASQLNRRTKKLKARLLALTEFFSDSLQEELAVVGNVTRYQQYLNILIFFIAVSVSLIMVSLIISRWVTRPLKKAAALARSMSAGDLSRKLDIQQRDEIGELAHAMNVMAGEVAERTSRLEETNEKLANEITERKKTELELLWVTAAVDSASDAIGIASKDLTHFYQNRAFFELFGYTVAELNYPGGKPMLTPHHTMAPQLYDAVLEGDTWIGELETVSRYGEKIPIFSRVHPIKDNFGNIVGVMGIFSDIRERKKAEAELEAAHKKLVETAWFVGRAEVATSVLHNVGNVLNSVNVTASSLRKEIRYSKISNFPKAALMIEEHRDALAHFLTKDEKGKKLPAYLVALSKHLEEEREIIDGMLADLCNHVKLITELIAIQQSHSTSAGLTEVVSVCELLEHALQINASGMSNHNIEIIREFEDIPPCRLDRHQFLQIIINLLSNARQAVKESDNNPKIITVRLKRTGADRVSVEVADNGIGIPGENLGKIFYLGFTTRKEGHGFGLHSAAICAKKMGGSLNVCSGGPGKGAVFTFELPLRLKEDKNG